MCGLSLGFFLGIIMVFMLWELRMSRQQRMGVITGILMNGLFAVFRQNVRQVHAAEIIPMHKQTSRAGQAARTGWHSCPDPLGGTALLASARINKSSSARAGLPDSTATGHWRAAYQPDFSSADSCEDTHGAG